MKYYKAEIYYSRITEVEVTKETDKCVYVADGCNGKEQRFNKIGNYDCYFKDFEVAKNHLRVECENNIERKENTLNNEKLKLGRILAISKI